MDDLTEAIELVFSTSPSDTRLIGGLAVAAHVGRGARETHDVDVVVMSETARATLCNALQQHGYAIGTTGHWWRAAPTDGSRRFVDIAAHPIVDVRTFETLHLRGSPVRVRRGQVDVDVASSSDLVLLKLMAHRPQDLVDLMMLARQCPLDAAEIARFAALDDIERTVARGAAEARADLTAGSFADDAAQILGREVGDDDTQALRTLLDALKEKGL